MIKQLIAILAFTSIANSQNVFSINYKLGTTYLSGYGTNGFLGAGEQPLPKGFNLSPGTISCKYNNYEVEYNFNLNEDNNSVSTGITLDFYVKTDGTTPFVYLAYSKDWMEEENWDWSDDSWFATFGYMGNRSRSIMKVGAGYRVDYELFSVDMSVGIIKGIASFRMPNPMPIASISISVPIYKDGSGYDKNFN